MALYISDLEEKIHLAISAAPACIFVNFFQSKSIHQLPYDYVICDVYNLLTLNLFTYECVNYQRCKVYGVRVSICDGLVCVVLCGAYIPCAREHSQT